jgi:hypothetical protein
VRTSGHTAFDDFPGPSTADPAWEAGTRVRIEKLRVGERFLAIDGKHYTYDRRDGALSGVYHVTCDDGTRTAFAGCAEVVVQP